MNPRHPEKINNLINPIKKKPIWIRTKITDTQKIILRLKKSLTKKNFILFVRKLVVQIFQNVGVKDMQHL